MRCFLSLVSVLVVPPCFLLETDQRQTTCPFLVFHMCLFLLLLHVVEPTESIAVIFIISGWKGRFNLNKKNMRGHEQLLYTLHGMVMDLAANQITNWSWPCAFLKPSQAHLNCMCYLFYLILHAALWWKGLSYLWVCLVVFRIIGKFEAWDMSCAGGSKRGYGHTLTKSWETLRWLRTEAGKMGAIKSVRYPISRGT